MAGIDLTLKFLEQAENPSVGDALLAALAVPDEGISTGAAIALVRRPETRLHMELLRRLEQFPGDLRKFAQQCSGGFEPILKQGLQRQEIEYRLPAIHLTRVLREFSVLPVLLNQIEDQQHPLRPELLEAIQELIDRTYDMLPPRTLESHPGLTRDQGRILEQVIGNLEQSAQRIAIHQATSVVEGLLSLTPTDHALFKKLLRIPGHPAHEIATQLLLTSTHPGVLTQLTLLLCETYPLTRVMQVFQSRTDPEFLCHWLRFLPRKLPPILQFNLTSLRQIAGLQLQVLNQQLIPPGLSSRLIQLAQAVGIPGDEKQGIIEWVLKHGDHNGRELAGKALADTGDEAVRGIVLEGLQSETAQVQAWATGQLRQRSIPHAFELLIDRLDSPIAEVQAAARAELKDFNVKRLLEMVDDLDQQRCVSAARLVLKIDPQALQKLAQELGHPMRSKRLRAADAISRAGLAGELVPVLAEFLNDGDPAVRRKGVQVLSQIPTWEVWNLLLEHKNDSHPRVRAEIELVLNQFEKQLDVHAPAEGSLPASDQKGQSQP